MFNKDIFIVFCKIVIFILLIALSFAISDKLDSLIIGLAFSIVILFALISIIRRENPDEVKFPEW